MMLTTVEIQDHLARITYRPGWTFTVTHDAYEGNQLRIVATLEDAFNPGHTIDLGINTYIPPIPDTDYLEHWLAYRLARIETHEAREFLRRDGEIIFDPHAAAA